jgi:hypothetical protein
MIGIPGHRDAGPWCSGIGQLDLLGMKDETMRPITFPVGRWRRG